MPLHIGRPAVVVPDGEIGAAGVLALAPGAKARPVSAARTDGVAGIFGDVCSMGVVAFVQGGPKWFARSAEGAAHRQPLYPGNRVCALCGQAQKSRLDTVTWSPRHRISPGRLVSRAEYPQGDVPKLRCGPINAKC